MKKQTIFFNNKVGIIDTSTIAGPKEGKGPLGKYFHNVLEDDILGQKSHERAEVRIHISVIKHLLNKTRLTPADIDCFFAGDLLDEIVGSSFTMREFPVPFFGMYNACATFGEALIIASAMTDAGYFNKAICSTSSHFSTAERQYRNPLELGSQRTPLSQWTVTGAGCSLIGRGDEVRVKIDCGTIGKVVDYGVNDVNDMGAAMMPAAMDTLLSHFHDTGRSPSYYDMILTGDLGDAGSRLLRKLIKEKGIELGDNYNDCGVLIFNREAQKVGQGGSGAACNNIVFNSYVYQQMLEGVWKRVLLVPTGALISRISPLQKETVPGIAHAVSLEVI